MPAFSEGDWPDPQTAITYIRSQPTGKPTMAMSPKEKSVALALIAGIAAARATAILQTAYGQTASTPMPQQMAVVAATPTPAQVSVALTSNSVESTAATANAPLPLAWLMLGSLLTIGVSVLLLCQRMIR
jgi:hypothetical protein